MLDPQLVVRDEPAVRTHLDIAHVLAVLATQMIEDVLRIGQACLRVGSAHTREATGLANASTPVQACRFRRGLIYFKPRVADSAGELPHRRFRPYFQWPPRTSQHPEHL